MVLRGHAEEVTSIMTYGNDIIYSASEDGSIKEWNGTILYMIKIAMLIVILIISCEGGSRCEYKFP
jgi:hypothetical protein